MMQFLWVKCLFLVFQKVRARRVQTLLLCIKTKTVVKILRCNACPQLVIKIAGQCNLLYVQWLESVEALRLLLEQLGRSPQSLLIRCLALICLSAPEERSWSRCFHPPLLVFSFPQEEKKKRGMWRVGGKSWFLCRTSPLFPPLQLYTVIYNERACPTEQWLICWLGSGLAGMTRDTWTAGWDLHTHCSTEVIEQVPQRTSSLGSLLQTVTVTAHPRLSSFTSSLDITESYLSCALTELYSKI